MMNRLRLLAIVLATGLVLAACGPGSESGDSEAYPSEEIRMIVPYAAGGPSDIAARALSDFMKSDLGETVVVENVPGGSGSKAYLELISSDADGYTIAMSVLPTAVLNYLNDDVGYTRKDFAPIGVATQVPSALVVPASSPYADLKALFADSRANPEQVTVATPGATSTAAAETRRITEIYDVPLTVVPFNGNQGVRTALLGKNVVAGFVGLGPDTLPSIESGKLRVLAVGTEKRLSYVDAPTFTELGYPKLTQSTGTFALVAPAGTPKSVVSRLEKSMRAATADPTVREAVGKRYVPEQFIGSDKLGGLYAETEQAFKGVADGS